jgi:hypothetical protein
MPTTADRFWAKVDKTETCWLWTASTFTGGYGAFSWNGRTGGAHRYAYETWVGPIPEGHDVDHLCHVRRCVNPAHMQTVTKALNQQNRAGANATNKSCGYRNVSAMQGCSTWRVAVTVDGVTHRRFGFETAEAANLAAIDLRNALMVNNLRDRAA